MGEVVTPFGKFAPRSPDTDIVEDLERMLAEAKRGEIVAIAYACAAPNRDITIGWCNGDNAGQHTMLAALTGLQARYLQHWMESE
jgi:TusA-related sulfurtransferase